MKPAVRVLVTGANGFLGAWTVQRLLRTGMNVVALDLVPPGPLVQRLAADALAGVDWRIGDVVDATTVRDACADCTRIVHLAGLLTPACSQDPLRGAGVNVTGTLNVFEGARHHGIHHVVYASSAAVYGPAHARHPEPATLYGAFKLAAEGIARSYWRSHAIASLGLRPFVVYGPGRESGASAGISLACRAAAQGTAYSIPFIGRAGMVWVGDVVDVVCEAVAAELDGAHVIDLTGEVRSVDEVIAAIRRLHPEADLAAAGPPLAMHADIAPGPTTPWLPRLPCTPLDRGIAETLAFYRQARLPLRNAA